MSLEKGSRVTDKWTKQMIFKGRMAGRAFCRKMQELRYAEDALTEELRAELAQVKKERDNANANASKIATESILGAAVLKERAEKAEQEAAALRELMNCYNLGGWADAERLLKERDKAEQENARLREALAWYEEQADALYRYLAESKTNAVMAVVTALSLRASARTALGGE